MSESVKSFNTALIKAAEHIEQVQANEPSMFKPSEPTDTDLIDGLRKLCGYVENGTSTSITIFQDDATKDWLIHVGTGPRCNWTHGRSFREVIQKAIEEFGEE